MNYSITHLFLASYNHLEHAHCCASLGLIRLSVGVQTLQHIKGLWGITVAQRLIPAQSGS